MRNQTPHLDNEHEQDRQYTEREHNVRHAVF